MLERHAMDKRSSLLQKVITFSRVKFYNIGPSLHTGHIIRGLSMYLMSVVAMFNLKPDFETVINNTVGKRLSWQFVIRQKL